MKKQKRNKQQLWTKDEVEKLKELFHTISCKEIAILMSRSYKSITTKANKLKLSKPEDYFQKRPNTVWTDEIEQKLIELYQVISTKEIALLLNKTEKSISSKAKKLKLIKTDNYVRQPTKTVWTIEMEQKLIELYPTMSNENLANIFNKTESSISHKANKLKIEKSDEYIRDLSFEFVKNIARTCRTKKEFKEKDSSAYSAALRKGWIDEVCSHMLSIRFSTPQLILLDFLKQLFPTGTKMAYNDRKTIKPLELDIWIPEYKLAFEYDGKHWHKEPNNKKVLCKNINIELIVIEEDTRKYKEDIKKQLLVYLNTINNQTNLNVAEEQINNLEITDECFDSILDIDGINEICQQYTTVKEFESDYPNLYDKIVKMDKLNEFTNHMERAYKSNRFWYDVDNIIDAVNKCTTLKELRDNYAGCYNVVIKNKEYLPLIEQLEKGCVLNGHWKDINNIIEVVNKYKNLKDLRENDLGCYIYIKRNPETRYLIEHLDRGRIPDGHWDDENIIAVVNKYITLKEFREKEYNCYQYIMNNPEKKPLISHLEKAYVSDEHWRNHENIKEVAIKYTKLNEFIEKESACYSYIMKHQENLPLISHLDRDRFQNGHWKDKNNMMNAINKYTTLKDFIDNDNSCYIFINRNKEYLPLIAHLERFSRK
jgi:hypothetical protein